MIPDPPSPPPEDAGGSPVDAIRAQYPGLSTEMAAALALAEKLDAMRKRKRAKEKHPDAAVAARNDAHCLETMAEGTTAEGRSWVEQARTTLGVMDHAASVDLIATLYRTGAVLVHVCKIADDGADGQTSNHVIVEFPADPDARKRLLALQDQLAQKEGLEGDPEDGQRYGLIWFD